MFEKKLEEKERTLGRLSSCHSPTFISYKIRLRVKLTRSTLILSNSTCFSREQMIFFIKIPFGSKTSTVSGRATLSIMVIPSLNPEDSSDFSCNPSDPSDSSGFEDSSEGF